MPVTTNNNDAQLRRLALVLEGAYSPLIGSSAWNNTAFAPAIATRRMATLKGLGFDPDDTWEMPVRTGDYAGTYDAMLQMSKVKGKVPAEVWVDDLYWWLKMGISGSPSWATLPSTPTVLLAATNILASMTLTTQPNAGGLGDGALARMLQVTLSNASTSATPATVTITGTNVYGASISEALAFSAGTQTPSASASGNPQTSCTLWTKNYFATVTGITTSAQPTGDQLAVAGVCAFKYTWQPDMTSSTLYSATGEYWDGAVFWQLYGLVLEKLMLDLEAGKSFKAEADLFAQSRQKGALSSSPIVAASAVGSYGAMTNLPVNPMSAVTAATMRFYADALGAAAGTTQVTDRLLAKVKLDFGTKAKAGKGASGFTHADFVGREAYGEATKVDFTVLAGDSNDTELAAYLTAAPRTLRFASPGPALPCGPLSVANGWPASLADASGHGGYWGISLDVSGQYTKQGEADVDGRHGFTFALNPLVDITTLGLNGFLGQLVTISRVNPNQS